MDEVKRFFTAPAFDDETQTRRASLLSFIVNLHLVIAVGIAILLLGVSREYWFFSMAALLTCLPALGVRVLIRQGRVTLAALVFIGFIAVTIPVVALAGQSSVGSVSVTAFQFVTLVMAGLLLGGRGAFGFLVFAGLVDGLLLYAEAHGWYSATIYRSYVQIWATQMITYAAVASLLWLANRLIQESFSRALRESDERRMAEARQRALLDAIPELVFRIRRDGVFVDYHAPSISRLLVAPEQFVGRPVQTVMPPDIAARTMQAIEQVLQTGQATDFEYSLAMQDQVQYFEARMVACGPDEVLTSVRDITERKQAEQEIQSLARFPSENPNPVLRLNQDGRILYANEASQLLLRDWAVEIGGQAPPFWQDQVAGALGSQSVLTAEARCGKIVYSFVVLPVSPPGYVNLYAIDITERKSAEAEREKLIAELEAKNAELERFVYTVSHDLKSPLVTIMGFLAYVERDGIAGDVDNLQADVQRIAAAVGKLQLLLNDLLELSRIGRVMNSAEETPLEAIVQETLELIKGRMDERGVQIDIQPDLPVVHGDRTRLMEVLQNLIDNACKFMGDQPEPRITIGRSGTDGDGKPILFVRDNGIGIDPQYQEKVFGLFDKLDPKSEGTGIGLALVKRIVEVHGGRIWVESAGLKTGATFYFTLPVKSEIQDKTVPTIGTQLPGGA